MKRILLASASLVAFAGVAAADHVNEDTANGVTLGGSGLFGFNDEVEDGFFVEGNVGFTLAQELNNGLLAAITFGIDFADDRQEGDDRDFGGQSLEVGSIVLSLTDRTGQNGLHFGDTEFAAERHWDAIPALAADDFSEQSDETVIRGDAGFGGFNGSLSYIVADSDGDAVNEDPDNPDMEDGDESNEYLDQMSIGVSGAVGNFNVRLAYQEESDAAFRPVDTDEDGDIDGDDDDFSQGGIYDHDLDDDLVDAEVFGIAVGTTFAGADTQIAYATNRTADESSLGVAASLPVGPVEISGYYTFEMSGNDDDPTTDVDESDPEDSFGVEASYSTDQFGVTVGYEDEQGDDDTYIDASFNATEDLTVFAGFSRDEEGYVAAEYDLGNGASLLASYAETDEAGPNDYKEGTTVALSLGF